MENLTKREQFAALFMSKLLKEHDQVWNYEIFFTEKAQVAIKAADCLLKELKKTEEEKT